MENIFAVLEVSLIQPLQIYYKTVVF